MYPHPTAYSKNPDLSSTISHMNPSFYSNEESPILKQFSEPDILIPKAERRGQLWKRESIVSGIQNQGSTTRLTSSAVFPTLHFESTLLQDLWCRGDQGGTSLQSNQLFSPDNLNLASLTSLSRQNPEMNASFKEISCESSLPTNPQYSMLAEAQELPVESRDRKAHKSLHSSFKMPIKIRNSEHELFPTLEELSELCEDLRRQSTKIEAIQNLAKSKSTEFQNDSLSHYLSDNSEGVVKQREFPIKVVYPIPTDFSRSLMLVYKDKYTHKLLSKVVTILPNFQYELKPISPLKVVSTPLTRFLTYKPSKNNGASMSQKPRGFETGFLTLDEQFRVLPFMENDQLALQYPLVGVWVYNIPGLNSGTKQPLRDNILKHPLVWAACTRFLLCDQFQAKYSPSIEQNSFLLICFQGSENERASRSSHNSAIFLEFKAIRSQERARDANHWIVVEQEESSAREVSGFERFEIKLRDGCDRSRARASQESIRMAKLGEYLQSLEGRGEKNEESAIVFDPPTLTQTSSFTQNDKYPQRCPSASGQRTLRRENPQMKLARAFSYQTLRSSSQSTIRSNGGRSKADPAYQQREQEYPVISRQTSYQNKVGNQDDLTKEKSDLMMTLGANFSKQSDYALSSQEKSEINSYPSKNMSSNSSPIHSGSLDGGASSTSGQYFMKKQKRRSSEHGLKESINTQGWGFSPTNPMLNISTASSIFPPPPPHPGAQFPNPQYPYQYGRQNEVQPELVRVIQDQAQTIQLLQQQIQELQKCFMNQHNMGGWNAPQNYNPYCYTPQQQYPQSAFMQYTPYKAPMSQAGIDKSAKEVRSVAVCTESFEQKNSPQDRARSMERKSPVRFSSQGPLTEQNLNLLSQNEPTQKFNLSRHFSASELKEKKPQNILPPSITNDTVQKPLILPKQPLEDDVYDSVLKIPSIEESSVKEDESNKQNSSSNSGAKPPKAPNFIFKQPPVVEFTMEMPKIEYHEDSDDSQEVSEVQDQEESQFSKNF